MATSKTTPKSKSTKYELVDIEPGIYSVGSIPQIDTSKPLPEYAVKYLLSIKWPHIVAK